MSTAVGVVGAGTMGVGIAYVFAAAGCRTIVVEPDERRMQAMHDVIAEQANRGLVRGKLNADRVAEMTDLLTTLDSVADLPRGLDLVVESVPERLPLKHEILDVVERCEPTVLATNTSALSIEALAAPLQRPDAFLGMHFFNPVWSLQLVELVRGAATSDATLRRAQEFVDTIGKQWIVVRDVAGFATSRLDLVAALEAMRMLESGVASAQDIDKAALLAYRHPMGPLRLSDVVGLDVRLDIARTLADVYGERFAPPQILIDKVAAGELGQKSGRGFFDWSDSGSTG